MTSVSHFCNKLKLVLDQNCFKKVSKMGHAHVSHTPTSIDRIATINSYICSRIVFKRCYKIREYPLYRFHIQIHLFIDTHLYTWYNLSSTTSTNILHVHILCSNFLIKHILIFKSTIYDFLTHN